MRLSTRWDDGGLWDDIQVLAGRFWNAKDDKTRLLCWHHLVLAVGNFKRQPGRRLRPSALASLDDYRKFARSEATVIPGVKNTQRICADDSRSWQSLMDVLPGARTATTTTLLAALWPEKHVVFDRRVHWAANALRICSKLCPTLGIEPRSSSWQEITLGDYVVIRDWLLATAEQLRVPPNAIERALYLLDSRVPSSEGETWSHYAERIGQQLSALSPVKVQPQPMGHRQSHIEPQV
jgi:hypothetical protein